MPEPLDDADIATALADLDGWTRVGDTITKDFTFDDFAAAFAFMTRMAQVSESMDHHPDWSNSWNTVSVTLSSHDAGGITQRDLDWAASADTSAG